AYEAVNNDVNDYQQTFNQFEIEHQLANNEHFSSHLALSYLRTDINAHLQVLAPGALTTISAPASQAPFLSKAIFKVQNFRANLANDWTINNNSSVQFGVSLLKNEEIKARSFSNYNLLQLLNKEFPVTYFGEVTFEAPLSLEDSQTASGVYAQYLHQFNADTRINIGARYDYYNDFGGHTSPRIGLIHQLDKQNTLKILYGEAFRAPALSELGVINTPLTLGNQNLTYECIKTWELIWHSEWHHTAASLDVFHSRYSNPISVGFIGNVRQSVNSQNDHTSGIELEASQEFLQHWLLRATYTHLFELPAASFREADNFASLMLNFKQQKLNWNIAAIYQAQRFTQEQVNILQPLPAFWMADSKLSYEFSDAYKVNLKIKNLFDKEFSTPALSAGLVKGIPHRGREWSVGLEWNY
ncbi:MAG: hypothetical protein RL497_2330, partial [Pseudomonadota bacterium]